MKRIHVLRRAALLLCLTLCLLAQPISALAYDDVDINRAVTLALEASFGGEALSGLPVTLHRVATLNEKGWYRLLNAYAGTGVEVNKITGSAWDGAIDALNACAVDIPPTATATINNGRCTLEGLPQGLYLVNGLAIEQGDWLYSFAPFIVSLPDHSSDGTKWVYDVRVDMKMACEPMLTDIEVIKVWKDTGNADLRPASIEADLFCDGTLYQTVELTAANNWHYVFHDLERAHKWTVQEHVLPNGYTASYSTENGALIITNTLIVTTTTPPDIPQTGMLWWPVPLLAAIGMTLFVLGYISHRKWRREHEES